MTEKKQTLLEFPCSFTVKVMGLSGQAFEEEVFSLVQPLIPELKAEHIRSRPSKQGKYCSLSISLTATSKQQLDQIYRVLTDCESVLMAL